MTNTAQVAFCWVLRGEEEPLHIQCSYPSRLLIKIITVYEPDKNVWMNYRSRRA